MTTAVSIVRAGRLESRNNAPGFIDVANQGALHHFQGSHEFARLYFRPKNMFHLRTEGILCETDRFRLPEHMSIPVMFLFRFVEVITNPNAQFSSGNVQSSQTWLDGDAAFDALDFNSIYHDAALSADRGPAVRNMRMSEVGVRNGLNLQGNLSAILFRTKSDMETFKYLIELEGIDCPYSLGVEQISQSIFQSRGLFLRNVSASGGTLSLDFNFPVSNAPADGQYRVRAVQSVPGSSVWKLDKKLKLERSGLRIRGYSPSDGIWKIELESQLAFNGRLKSEVSSIFE